MSPECTFLHPASVELQKLEIRSIWEKRDVLWSRSGGSHQAPTVGAAFNMFRKSFLTSGISRECTFPAPGCLEAQKPTFQSILSKGIFSGSVLGPRSWHPWSESLRMCMEMISKPAEYPHTSPSRLQRRYDPKRNIYLINLTGKSNLAHRSEISSNTGHTVTESVSTSIMII